MVQTHATDNSERRVLDDISEYGWHCVGILPDEDSVAYSFTIGLYQSYGHPELIIFGLKSNVAHKVLANAVEALRGKRLDLSQLSDELLEGSPCCFAEVPKACYYEYAGFAHWYYQGNDFPLYQIVWPSRSGYFPWHPKANEAFKLAQPVIAVASRGG